MGCRSGTSPAATKLTYPRKHGLQSAVCTGTKKGPNVRAGAGIVEGTGPTAAPSATTSQQHSGGCSRAGSTRTPDSRDYESSPEGLLCILNAAPAGDRAKKCGTSLLHHGPYEPRGHGNTENLLESSAETLEGRTRWIVPPVRRTGRNGKASNAPAKGTLHCGKCHAYGKLQWGGEALDHGENAMEYRSPCENPAGCLRGVCVEKLV